MLLLLDFFRIVAKTASLPLKRKGVTRIICIGDSITYGHGSSNSHEHSYPYLLSKLLNESRHEVFNLGLGSRTMMKKGDRPYWDEKQYQDAIHSQADIIFLMLGTNDAKIYQWNVNAFTTDYVEMGNELLKSTNAKLYLMIPPPLYKETFWKMNQTVINDIFPKLIPEIASEISANGVIDLFQAFGGTNLTMSNFLADGCHPNDQGYQLIAETIYGDVFVTEQSDNQNESLICDLATLMFCIFVFWRIVNFTCCNERKNRFV